MNPKMPLLNTFLHSTVRQKIIFIDSSEKKLFTFSILSQSLNKGSESIHHPCMIAYNLVKSLNISERCKKRK